MRNELCPHEKAVLEALRSSQWEEGLRRHFQECAECQEAQMSSEWMRGAAVPLETRPLPDPDVLWIRAGIAAREREASRLVWRSAFRNTVLYGSLSAGGTWLALDTLRANPMDSGAISFGVLILTAAIVHFTPLGNWGRIP